MFLIFFASNFGWQINITRVDIKKIFDCNLLTCQIFDDKNSRVFSNKTRVRHIHKAIKNIRVIFVFISYCEV